MIKMEVKCVNSHDRCDGGPCPYCEADVEDLEETKYAVELYKDSSGQQDLYAKQLREAYEKGYLVWRDEVWEGKY